MMKEKNIREMARRMNLVSIDDMCRYSIPQLVVMIANKLNELFDEVWRFETDVQETLKTQNENIQYLLGEGLHLEVENIFDGWVNDGTFDTLINHSVLKSVNDRIDETNAQLSQKANDNEVVKKGYGTLNDFDEQTRSILLGLEEGQVNAVLGDGNVNFNNLNGSVINGIYEITENPTSLLPTNEINDFKVYFNSTYSLMGFQAQSNHKCKIFQLEGGKNYTIRGRGMTGENNPIAVICGELVTDTSQTKKYLAKFPGSSSSQMTYEEVKYTPTVSCYAYVNGNDSTVSLNKNEYQSYALKNKDEIKSIKTIIDEQVVNGKVDETKLSEDLTNAIYTVSEELKPIDEEVVIDNYKACANSTYKLMGFQSTSYGCKVFALSSGKTYQLKGYGMVGDNNCCVVICNQLVTNTSSTTKYVDYFEGSSSSNMNYEWFTYTPNTDCYAYVNGESAEVCVVVNNLTPHSLISERKIEELSDRLTSIEGVGGIGNNNGCLVSDGLKTITHFTKSKNNLYICRVFKHVFINKLLQLESMYLGEFIDGELIEVEKIGTSNSDVIGPISIHRGDVDNWTGSWSGGTHGITVNGVEYPTAKELECAIYVNNELITKDGYYYGDTKIIVTNDLYMPRTVTGSDLSTATKAIKETRTYTLVDKMEVDVQLEFYLKTYVTTYYGCQCNTYNMTKAIFPNNEIKSNIRGLSNQVNWKEKESKYFCENENNAHYDVELKNYGLGSWKYNTSTQFGYLATFSKIYFILIQNESGKVRTFNTDKILKWGAIYDYY